MPEDKPRYVVDGQSRIFVNSSVIELREAWATARLSYEAAALEERVSRATLEADLITHLGGDPKALGSNEKERERNLLIAVASSESNSILRDLAGQEWAKCVLAFARLEAFYLAAGQPLPYISTMEAWH